MTVEPCIQAVRCQRTGDRQVEQGGDKECWHGGVVPGVCGGGELQKVSIERKRIRVR